MRRPPSDPKTNSGVFLAGMIVAMTASQVMFKFAGNYVVTQRNFIGSLILNPWLWAGLLCSGGGMACWLLALREIPLARAYPWTAMVYVFTPLLSVLLFGEVLSMNYLIGMVCIVVGVFLATGEGRDDGA